MSAPPDQSRKMRHRSFYMSTAAAAALTKVVDDIHFTTRRPRHEVWAALADVSAEHQEEITERLSPADSDRQEAST